MVGYLDAPKVFPCVNHRKPSRLLWSWKELKYLFSQLKDLNSDVKWCQIVQHYRVQWKKTRLSVVSSPLWILYRAVNYIFVGGKIVSRLSHVFFFTMQTVLSLAHYKCHFSDGVIVYRWGWQDSWKSRATLENIFHNNFFSVETLSQFRTFSSPQ